MVNKPTMGEEFLENFFYESNIKYKTQIRLNDLQGDSANFRVIDFYLPRLGFFVEYDGMYNNSKIDRDRYKLKSKVLRKNRKPTVFLVPEDLGIIDHAFHVKVKRLFKYKIYHNRWRYFRYSLNRYFLKGKPHYFFYASIFYVFGAIIGDSEIESRYNMTFRNILSYSFYLIALFGFLKPFIFNFIHYVNVSDVIGFVKRDNLK